MPSYDSDRPKGSATLIVRTVEDLPRARRSLEPRDPIADLLRQVEDDIELETTSDRTLAEYRLADHQLAQQVRFELTLGRAWDGHATRQLFDDLWLYALPVIKAFLKRNRMNQVLQRYAPERHVTMRAEDMVVLRNSDEERTALAVDIIAAAVESFRDNAIGKHRWKASLRNASLRTYFIGTCAFAYPRTYIKWSKARAGKLEVLASQYDINLFEIGGIIARAVDQADPAAMAGTRLALKKVIDVATPTTKVILGMLAQDMNQQQIADKLGLTVKAVERRLAHLRARATHLDRPQGGRRPLGAARRRAA